MSTVLTSVLAGFGFGLSLIVAIGAQNAFVLRQGIRREHVLVIVGLCAISDMLLIAIGVAGLGTLITQISWLLVAIELLGGLFLLGYGIVAVRRVFAAESLTPDLDRAPTSLRATVLTGLALTFLNPHVYLDTVLLLGSIAGTFGDARWTFAIGAMVGSIVWFSALGFGARLLAPLFARPIAWRILDGFIAVVMFSLAASLLLSFAGHLAAL